MLGRAGVSPAIMEELIFHQSGRDARSPKRGRTRSLKVGKFESEGANALPTFNLPTLQLSNYQTFKLSNLFSPIDILKKYEIIFRRLPG